MFKWLTSSSKKSASIAPARKGASTVAELAIRASIVDKLKNYNSSEDTTISDFSLADHDNEKPSLNNMRQGRKIDVWGQANPSETGVWNRDDRRKKHG